VQRFNQIHVNNAKAHPAVFLEKIDTVGHCSPKMVTDILVGHRPANRDIPAGFLFGIGPLPGKTLLPAMEQSGIQINQPLFAFEVHKGAINIILLGIRIRGNGVCTRCGKYRQTFRSDLTSQGLKPGQLFFFLEHDQQINMFLPGIPVLRLDAMQEQEISRGEASGEEPPADSDGP